MDEDSVSRTIERALEVFGNEDKALSWLCSPCRALEGKVPIELAASQSGAESVDRELGRIDHGIIS